MIWSGSFRQNTHDRSQNITHKTIWSIRLFLLHFAFTQPVMVLALRSLTLNRTRCHITHEEPIMIFSVLTIAKTRTHRQYIYRMVGDFDEGRKKSLKCFMWNNWALHDRFCCCCFENWFGMICDQGVVERFAHNKRKTNKWFRIKINYATHKLSIFV